MSSRSDRGRRRLQSTRTALPDRPLRCPDCYGLDGSLPRDLLSQGQKALVQKERQKSEGGSVRSDRRRAKALGSKRMPGATFRGGTSPPERRNLEFLVGLRNKIEHRHLPDLDAGLYGECQAALLNLEELLTSEFGARYALAEQLAVSLQFTQLIPTEKKKAAKELASGAVKTVKEYVEKFRGGLPSSTLNNTKYSFNVFLVPKVANRKDLADAAVEFIKVDENNKDELARLEKLNILIKEKLIPIANLDLYKPTQVVAKVQASIPHKFTISAHTNCWHYFKVRPASLATKPEATDAKYCVYDAAHKDYLYTEAWVDKLSKDLADPAAFQAITGAAPLSK